MTIRSNSALRWFIIGPLICAVIPFVGVPLLEWAAVAPAGSDAFLWLLLLFILPGLAAFPCILGGLIGLASSRFRRRAAILTLCSVAYVAALPVASRIGEKVRMKAFHRLAGRSRPLVSAIHNYEKKYGHPPESLESLVPEFIAKVPATGIAAYPEYRYSRSATNRYHGNPWVITIFTPSGGINFDQFMYFPLTNYPEVGYGGRLERVGDWAYVHE